MVFVRQPRLNSSVGRSVLLEEKRLLVVPYGLYQAPLK
jgi:hypothetical protein